MGLIKACAILRFNDSTILMLMLCQLFANDQNTFADEPPSIQSQLAAAKEHWSKLDRESLRYDERGFSEWRQILETDLSPDTRAQAFDAMGVFGKNGYQKEAMAAILAVVRQDESLASADAMCRALQRMGPPGIRVLQQTIRHENENVRRKSAMWLRFTPARGTLPVLLAALHDENREVSKEAQHAIHQLLFPDEMGTMRRQLVQPMIDLLDDDSPELVGFACKMLWHLGSIAKPAIPSLLRIAAREEELHYVNYHNDPGFVQSDAIQALTRVAHSQEGLQAVREFIEANLDFKYRSDLVRATDTIDHFLSKHTKREDASDPR